MSDIIYILQCQKDKYYLGKCSRRELVKTLRKHRDGKMAAPWTRKFNAVKCLRAIKYTFENQLNIETERAMKRWGIKNVRGGDYKKILITPFQRRHVLRKIKWEDKACWKCGRIGHFVGMCKYNTYFNGEEMTDDEDDDLDSSESNKSGYTYSDKVVDDRPTPGMTWHSIPP
jgi:predicted GIY-YIG superfamily endonuclease